MREGRTTDGPGAPSRDAALLSDALAGDPVAVAAIYDRHAGPLYRLARCLVGRSTAEVVVVDTLVRACTCPGAVVAGRPLRGELLRVTYRACRQLPGARG